MSGLSLLLMSTSGGGAIIPNFSSFGANKPIGNSTSYSDFTLALQGQLL